MHRFLHNIGIQTADAITRTKKLTGKVKTLLDLLQKSQIRGTSRLELGSIDDLRTSKNLKARRL